DIDYYYVRARLGMAYFERKNYFKAVDHFKKALGFNSGDETSYEYLYYSFINTGNKKEAYLLKAKLNDSLIAKLKIKNKAPVANNFNFEFAINNNNSFDKQKEIDLETFPIGSKRNLVDRFINTTISLNHTLWKRIDYSHAFTFLLLRGIVQSRPTSSGGLNPPPAYVENNQSVSQKQYYGNLNFHLSAKSDFSIGTHLILCNTQTIIGTGTGKRNVQNNSVKEANYVLFAGYLKQFSYFKMNLFLSKGNINLDKQYQGSATLYYFPFGNLNIYGSTEFTGIIENDTTNRMIWQQSLGFKLLKNTWVETSYTSGNIKNYLEKNGLLVYNNMNTIKSKFEANIIYSFAKNHLKLYIRYINIENFGDHIYSNINKTDDIDFSNLNNITFYTNTIIGGLIWNF
ncbi:MAG: hypothetical protein ABIJ97_00470, partial [Bacteroidota bacterium]